MILSRKHTEAVLCGCAVLLLAILVPAPAHAQDAATPTQAVAPDNSARNKVHNKTADQQPNNSADRTTTKKIRRAIIGDHSLSTYAHNVKIITLNGVVTLKGPVRSDEEKQTIAKKAGEVAGDDKVMNQLTVEPEK